MCTGDLTSPLIRRRIHMYEFVLNVLKVHPILPHHFMNSWSTLNPGRTDVDSG